MELLDKIRKDGLVVIIRNIATEDILDTVKSLYDGGARVFEVALNSKDCYKQIGMLKEIYGDKIIIGAGTVINMERAQAAHRAGADFYLTPGLDDEVLRYSLENSIPVIPGVFTPSEVQKCLGMGFSFLKLFPANSLHMNYVKNLKGPYDEFDVMAVGGVSEENLEDFLKAGHTAAGMGGKLVDKELIAKKDWNGLKERVQRVRNILDRHKV